MNIFVAKLNFDTTSDGLRAAFEAFGEVESAKVIMDYETNKSRGFGFVEMPNEEQGLAAIEALNEQELDGNEIVVKKAEPRGGNRDRRGGGGGGYDRGGRGGGGGYDRGGRGGGGGYDRGGRGGGYDRNDRGSSYDRGDRRRSSYDENYGSKKSRGNDDNRNWNDNNDNNDDY